MKPLFRSLIVGWTLVAAALPAFGGGDPRQTTLPPPDEPIQVSIAAKVPTAYAAAGIPGSLMITRTGSVLQDLTVSYQISGKAVAGQDYRSLKGTRTILAGKSEARITIRPVDVAGSGGGMVKGVRVTLLPGNGYAVSAATKATVKIVR